MHKMLTNQIHFETVATPWLQYVRLILVQPRFQAPTHEPGNEANTGAVFKVADYTNCEL